MKKALITGITGQDGSFLAEFLLEKGYDASLPSMKGIGYKEIIVDSRVEVVPFYEKLHYNHTDDKVKKSGTFDCIRMKKSVYRI